MKCEIVGYREIEIGKLTPHPLAEAFPRGEDDQASVNASVGDAGILAPLHVLEAQDKQGKWLVVDGCTRLLAAMTTERGSGADQKLPCLLVKVDDVEAFVLHINGSRRRVSTGTRVLAYITCHKEAVLAASELAGGRVKNMRGSTNGLEKKIPKASREAFGNGDGPENWSVEAIAYRLGVSRDDVGCAVELLRCKELRRLPEMRVRGSEALPERPLDGDSAEDREKGGVVDECWLRVLGGATPIRRWKAAFGGRAAPEAGKGEADYGDLARRGLTSLRTALAHWDEIDPREIAGIIAIWRKTRTAALAKLD